MRPDPIDQPIGGLARRTALGVGLLAGMPLTDTLAATDPTVPLTPTGTLLDVRTTGAVGDGVADDTAAIQAALLRSDAVAFPSGVFKVSDTLRIPGPEDGAPFASFRLTGTGAPENTPWEPGFRQAGTNFVWSGPPDLPMFVVDRAKRIHVSHCAFFGAGVPGDGVRAGPTWLFCKRPGADFGTGASVFENVVMRGGRIGVQFGENREDHNCDTTSFFSCIFADLDAAVSMRADQALGFRFFACYATRCRSFLDAQAGGHVLVSGLSCNRCGGGDSWIFDIARGGPNALDFTFDGVRIENGSSQLLRTRGLCSVQFRNFVDAQVEAPRPLLDVTYGLVRFDGGRIASAGDKGTPFLRATGDRPRPAVVELRGILFGADEADTVSSIDVDRFARVQLDGCSVRDGVVQRTIGA